MVRDRLKNMKVKDIVSDHIMLPEVSYVTIPFFLSLEILMNSTIFFLPQILVMT